MTTCTPRGRSGPRGTVTTAGAKSTFGRDLRAVVPELGHSQPRVGGRQVWSYTHIGLAPVSPVSDAEDAGPEDFRDTGSPAPRGGTKPQVNDSDTGDTGSAPNVGLSPSGFVPPTDPGRCDVCGWHIPSTRATNPTAQRTATRSRCDRRSNTYFNDEHPAAQSSHRYFTSRHGQTHTSMLRGYAPELLG